MNLQNLPATGSRYAKIIKSCFKAPPGWVFSGLDFASLEDRISALLTKDPNKLAVYQGHLLYKITINGVDTIVADTDTVVYKNKKYTGKEFYETYS